MIALAILGEIATFTIPKIITAQQNGSNNAKAKEAMATISEAYQNYVVPNGLTSSVTANNLIQYVNYVSIDTTTTIDNSPGWGTTACSSTTPCLTLHNGAKLLYRDNESFGGTSATNGFGAL